MVCQQCLQKVTWEGQPVGEIQTIGGVPTYVTLPEGGGDKSKVLLYLTDVFGLDLPNNKLLADDFAKAGFRVYVPDYLGGDAIPMDALESGSFDLMAWIGKHGEEVTRPYLDKVIAQLKEDGVKEFSATGYCYGGKYTLALAFDKVITAGAVAHPSLLQVPGDLEKLATMGVPILFNTCEVDQQFPIEAQEQADKILGNGSREGKAYKRNYYPGCTHGFAVKSDKNDEKQKFGREDAFKQTVEW